LDSLDREILTLKRFNKKNYCILTLKRNNLNTLKY